MYDTSLFSPVKNLFFIILFIFYCFPLYLSAAGKDVSVKTEIKYEIRRSGFGYSLSSEVTRKEKILSDKPQNSEPIVIPESFYAKIEDIECKVNDKWISSDRISVKDVDREDIFIDDFKIHVVRLPDNIKPGDEIKLSYEEEYQDIVYFPVERIPNINAIDEFKIEIEHPEELLIDFDFFFPHKKFNYQVIKESGKTELKFDSLSYIPEAAYKDFKDVLAGIMVVIKKGGEYITPSTPASFMKWYSGLLKVNQSGKTDYKAFFKDKIKDDFSPIEKLTVINSYVRENIRYIANEKGINTIVPRAPSFVFDKKYGDCKDKAFLVSAIAKEYGLNVYPALVSTDEFLCFSFCHLRSFNHVICAYKATGGYTFFDPTSEYLSFAALGASLYGKPAFIVDSLNPHFETINRENFAPEMEIEISGDIGSLKDMKAKISLQKDLYSAAKNAMDRYKNEDYENYMSNLVVSYLRNISLEIPFRPDSVKHSPEKDNNTVTIEARADLSKFIITSSAKNYIPKTPFIFITDKILQREADSARLSLSGIPVLRMKILLKASAYSFSRDSLCLDSREISAGYYSSIKTGKDNSVLLEYRLQPPFYFLEPAEKPEFIKFCRSYFSNKNQMFILNRKTL